jgi:hypothetical protein
VTIDANAVTSTNRHAEVDLPIGMQGVLLGVSAHAHSVTSDPTIRVGTAADDDGYVVETNLTTAAQRLAIGGALAVSGRATVVSGTPIRVQVTNDTGDGHGVVNVGLWMYVTEHATNIQPD